MNHYYGIGSEFLYPGSLHQDTWFIKNTFHVGVEPWYLLEHSGSGAQIKQSEKTLALWNLVSVVSPPTSPSPNFTASLAPLPASNVGELWQEKLSGEIFSITSVDSVARDVSCRLPKTGARFVLPFDFAQGSNHYTLLLDADHCKHYWDWGNGKYFCAYCSASYKELASSPKGSLPGPGAWEAPPAPGSYGAWQVQQTCAHVWKESPGFSRMYKDCTKCQIKFEDYEKEGRAVLTVPEKYGDTI
jgi:hypothetical protein